MNSFEQLELIAPLLKSLAENDYRTPTPIQSKTIPAALDGRDVLGSAQTGTGKTAAFALPVLNRLGKNSKRPSSRRPKALILAPTRELAVQIGDSIRTYGKGLRLRTALVYGGVSQHKQVRQLKDGVHIIVATPGRLLDLMDQGYIELDELNFFVLDEADRMLDMGFLPDLNRIISFLPDRRQSLFFSATMPPRIVELSRKLLRNPIHVNVAPKQATVDQITQKVLFTDTSSKKKLLCNILDAPEVERSLIFTRTKRTANRLAQMLVAEGVKATAIHGDKSQNARQAALDRFRNNRVRVLVATDVAARGIDVDQITHVINYDMPTEPESYVHRIGRTGRAGSSGIAISFCVPDERRSLRLIEKELGKRLEIENPESAAAIEAVAAAEAESNHSGSGRSYKKSRPDFRSNSRSGKPRPKSRSRRKGKPNSSTSASQKPGGSSSSNRKPSGSSSSNRKPNGSKPTNRKPGSSSRANRRPGGSNATSRKPSRKRTPARAS